MNIAVEIVEEVAEREQSSPLNLPPLYDTIDVDSLERCIDSADEYTKVQFSYCNYKVTVKGDRTIYINKSETSGNS